MAGHLTEGQAPQLRLELLPALGELLAPQALVAQAREQQIQVAEQGQQQVAAMPGGEPFEGEQVTAVVTQPHFGRLVEPLADRQPHP